MRVLVTGGAGFLGQHLCRKLIRQGHEVICADNFYTGQRAHVADLLDNWRFELLRHDITFPLYVECDRIFNLACPASPVHYRRHPVQTVKTSVHGAINMLGLAKRIGARILQASTSEVYGDPKVHPQPEWYRGDVNQLGPRGCYDEGKRCAETLFASYAEEDGVEVRIARIFNTYGPGMHEHDGRVVSNFIMQALTGQPLTIYGDGTQTRSFCYVSDMVGGLIALMESDVRAPCNLGNPEEVTIRHLAEQVLDITGSSSPIVHKELPEDDPVRRCPDIGRAKKALGFEPTVRLREGLEHTARYFKGVFSEAS